MVTFSLVCILATLVPYISWRTYRTSSALFVAAAVIWTFFAVTMILTHGLSKSFDLENGQVTLSFWQEHLKRVAHYAIPAIVLIGMEKWRISPNQRITSVLFWCFNFSFLAALALTHFYYGYEYPPIWYETSSPEHVEMMTLVTGVSNAAFILSKWIFLGLVAWKLAQRIPSVAKNLLATLRSF